jgi:hypothetical protein
MAATQTAFDFEACFAPESVAPPRGPAPERYAPNSNATATKKSQRAAAPRRRTRVTTPVAFDREANERLEAALRSALTLPVRVTLTDNRRTMISIERSPKRMHVRLHHMFVRADTVTLDALGSYLASADRHAAQQIGRFIEQHRTTIRGRAVRPVQLSAMGLHHNLNDIYRDVNAQYFANRVEAKITWSRDAQLRSRRSPRSIKLGSYTARDKLIRVHPALDAAFVPRFFVEYIVYHEMLHYVLPPRRSGKRRSLHGPEFQARERDFEQFEAALQWERENLARLLTRR